MKINQSEQDIEAIRSALRDGQERLVWSPVSLGVSWFSLQPSDDEQLMSNYGVGAFDPDFAHVFEEEVRAVQGYLEDAPDEVGVADPAAHQSPAALALMKSLNVRARAISIWERIAVPIRIKDGRAYRIWAPRDVLGTPIVKSVPISAFVVDVCRKTAEDHVVILQLQQRLVIWRAAAVLLGVFLLLRFVN